MDSTRVRLRIFMLLMAALMAAGTVGFVYIENMGWGDALYFCIVTVATVGYGDISPATQPGKVFAVFLIVTGVGVFLGVVANATELMLARRERAARLEKLDMIVGVFFSEVGVRLLTLFATGDPKIDLVKDRLKVSENWTDKHFKEVKQAIRDRKKLEPGNPDIVELRDFLNSKMRFLLRLLENPNLLEHESFTNLLMAVFHLADELRRRDLSQKLPEKDLSHIAGDVNRAYKLLVDQWLDHMCHLKNNYPYLFSLSMRTNPFDKDASVVIE